MIFWTVEKGISLVSATRQILVLKCILEVLYSFSWVTTFFIFSTKADFLPFLEKALIELVFQIWLSLLENFKKIKKLFESPWKLKIYVEELRRNYRFDKKILLTMLDLVNLLPLWFAIASTLKQNLCESV